MLTSSVRSTARNNTELLIPVARHESVSHKRASQWGALFVCLYLCLLLCVAQSATAQTCAVERVDETAALAKVIDGDTLRLKDGRSVRMIGINTTEIRRDGKPSEPLAEQARKTVQSMLGRKAKVGLRFDRERHDQYGRLLAHVYLANGQSIEEHLLKTGLAAQIVVPPNSENIACYQAAEQQARAAQKGLWLDYYRPLPIKKVPADARGFRVITGKVLRVGKSKKSWWLNFLPRPRTGESSNGVAVRISRDDLVNFDQQELRALPGKTIIVRGWLYPYKKQQVMRLRHAANFEVIN